MFDQEQELQAQQEQAVVDQEATVPQQEAPMASAAPQETPKDKNFKALRESKERAERERDEAIRRLQEIQMQSQQSIDEEIHLGPDELAEGKHLSKVAKKIKHLEEQLKNYQQQNSEVTIETRLKAQYPDLDAVVNKENIEALKNAYPEIAQTINNSPDLYSKAVSAYTLIKKLGIMPSEDIYHKEREIVQKNAAKPKPLASVSAQQGDSPLSKANAFANGLTDELKLQLRKEMEEARRAM